MICFIFLQANKKGIDPPGGGIYSLSVRFLPALVSLPVPGLCIHCAPKGGNVRQFPADPGGDEALLVSQRFLVSCPFRKKTRNGWGTVFCFLSVVHRLHRPAGDETLRSRFPRFQRRDLGPS